MMDSPRQQFDSSYCHNYVGSIITEKTRFKVHYIHCQWNQNNFLTMVRHFVNEIAFVDGTLLTKSH